MDKYEVVGSLGEGSFGRVYKAKQLSNGQFVALKVISKRGRSANEIKELRGECEIQRHLHHPNIIQMLDSFETDNEIVVITEFAHKELNTILGERGYLPESSVRTIVWDLVSALYYLHSHRVLHRDLKPQNILLDSKNKAKLCDFGFARNMSTGTHVLTSIKGTPLYMAPELIDELPYDHNADLWSLGCIIYELLVGAPPFCTASILHLIRLIKNEPVQWPTFLSNNCISFLKGLLQKDPKKRMSWTEILNHPWVRGKILILEDDLNMPLTKTLSMNTMNLKDLQRREHVNQKNSKSSRAVDVEQKHSSSSKTQNSKESTTKKDIENNNAEINEKMCNLSLDSKKEHEKLEKSNSINDSQERTVELTFVEESHLIQTEEWTVFLLKSIEEVMGGEMISLTQENLTNILVSPLRNSTTSPTVVTYIVKLFSIPFVVKGIPKTEIENMKKVYLKVSLVPNLLHCFKLLFHKRTENDSESNDENFKKSQDLTNEELECLECMFQLICHLVYVKNEFLVQFNDSLTVLNIFEILHKIFSLAKKRPKIVLDLVAIVTHILKKTPNNSVLVENILHLDDENECGDLNIVNLLRHENAMMRERLCYLLMYLGRIRPNALDVLMDENVKETLEALMFDSIEFVRNAAENCVAELRSNELL